MEKSLKHGKLAVFGIYKTKVEIERAVEALKAREFSGSDISVLIPTEGVSNNLAHKKSNKAPEGVTAGATGGLLIGGTIGWLMGLGVLTIPGIGPFVAAGPIVVALAGAGLGGTLGGVTGALVGMGIPEYEAKRYEDIVKNGGFLLSVHADNREWRDLAKRVLGYSGASDIASTGEVREKKKPNSSYERSRADYP